MRKQKKKDRPKTRSTSLFPPLPRSLPPYLDRRRHAGPGARRLLLLLLGHHSVRAKDLRARRSLHQRPPHAATPGSVQGGGREGGREGGGGRGDGVHADGGLERGAGRALWRGGVRKGRRGVVVV